MTLKLYLALAVSFIPTSTGINSKVLYITVSLHSHSLWTLTFYFSKLCRVYML